MTPKVALVIYDSYVNRASVTVYGTSHEARQNALHYRNMNWDKQAISSKPVYEFTKDEADNLFWDDGTYYFICEFDSSLGEGVIYEEKGR